MSRPHSEAEADETGDDLILDLTPMLDVLFMLLVFFLLTANSAEHALRLALPDKETHAAHALEEKTTLRIGLPPGAASWVVDGRSFADWEDAKQAILAKGAGGDLQVIVEGERSVSIERLMQVLGFLAANGFSTTNVLVEKEN